MSSQISSNQLDIVNLFYFNNHNNHPVDLLVGEIICWPNDLNIPKGFLECDGSAISRTEYVELYNVINNKFGNGDGSTTFNIPNTTDRLLKMDNITSGSLNNSQQSTNVIGGQATINIFAPHVHDITHSTTQLYSNYNTEHAMNFNYKLPVPNNIPNDISTAANADATTNNSHQKRADYGKGTNNRSIHAHHAHTFTYSGYNLAAHVTTINGGNNIGNYINTLSGNIDYTISNNSSDTQAYIPKYKKVFYLIYTGKH